MTIYKILENYNTNFSLDFVKAEIKNILATSRDKFYNTKSLKKIFHCIDLTSLNVKDNVAKIKEMTKKVNYFKKHFTNYDNVAGICVYPNYVKTVHEILTDKDVKIVSVGACFPASQSFIEVKKKECKMAIKEGAHDVDVVINVGEIIAGNYQKVFDELITLQKVCKNVTLKVILETGELTDCNEMYNASIIALYAGADFIKTSTGKVPVNATLGAAYCMCSALKDYYKETGNKRGFKAAGGISSAEEAVKYYTLVKHMLGEDWLDNSLFRIGASRLCNNLLSIINELEEKKSPVIYF